MPTHNVFKRLPILCWGKRYQHQEAVHDVTAALIVTLLLMPQALAYAMLAGLPPQVGLYASMLPLVVYACFGTSSTLAIGPVAITALMTASAIHPYAMQSPDMGLAAAMVLAILVGGFLLFAGLLKLGFLADFLSHAVISGFISATSLLIAASQIPSLLGMHAWPPSLSALFLHSEDFLKSIHLPSLGLAMVAIITLMLSRHHGEAMWKKCGFQPKIAQGLTSATPALLIVVTTFAMQYQLAALTGVATIGALTAGLPSLGWPDLAVSHWQALGLPAMLIAAISYVESIALARQQAMQRHTWIAPDQELIALGMANLSAGLSAGLPVAGGLSRSVANQDAGAKTPAAGLFAGVCVMFATYYLATWLQNIPKPVLAATLLVAALRMFDGGQFKHTWQLNKHDFIALCITFFCTLLLSVTWGIAVGVMVSIALTLFQTSRPHMAVVGLVPGTQHYKNVERHQVETSPHVLTIRIDAHLFFANIHTLEQRIYAMIAQCPEVKHLILMCSAINHIDASAVAGLTSINHQLAQRGIGFHLSEVKGPVMDMLKKTALFTTLNGQIFSTQHIAYETLAYRTLK